MSSAFTSISPGDGGKLAENVMHFGRVLRAKGPKCSAFAVTLREMRCVRRAEDLLLSHSPKWPTNMAIAAAVPPGSTFVACNNTLADEAV